MSRYHVKNCVEVSRPGLWGWDADQGSWSLQIQDFVFGGFTPYVQVYGLRNEVVGVPDGYVDPMYVYM